MPACTRATLARGAALLLLWHLPAAGSSELPVGDAAFATDDECAAAPGGDRCGLNALQRKGLRVGGLPPDSQDLAPAADEAGSPAAEEADSPSTNDGLSTKAACQDAAQGDACFAEIEWARSDGIQQHPEWYPGMSSSMPPADFQWIIHGTNPEKCPEPCSGTKRAPPPPAPAPAHHGGGGGGGLPADPPMPTPPLDPSACLCVFDIDRTLTAKQGSAGGVCAGTESVPGVEDNAYGGGSLVISELAKSMDKSFCNKCYLGVCSHGNADFEYSKERHILAARTLQSEPMKRLRLKPENLQWSDEKLLTPYVVYSPDGEKQLHVARILDFYKRQGINIAKENTYFFDDRADNVQPFAGTGMNARQISCGSRDMDIGGGAVGLCGATLKEIVREPGVVACPLTKDAFKVSSDVGRASDDQVESADAHEIPDAAVEAFEAEQAKEAAELENEELKVMEEIQAYKEHA